MTYLHYVIAAYAVFVLVMAWDCLVPQLQVRQQLRAARLRAARQARARAAATDESKEEP